MPNSTNIQETLLSRYLRHFLYLTIPGFFYLLGTALLINNFTGESLNDLKDIILHPNLFYSILFAILSYATGVVVHLAEQTILHFFIPKFKKEKFKVQDKVKDDQRNISEYYGIMLMIRHSFISLIVILLNLFPLVENKKGLVFIGSIILVILVLAYLKMRKIYVHAVNIQPANMSEKKEFHDIEKRL